MSVPERVNVVIFAKAKSSENIVFQTDLIMSENISGISWNISSFYKVVIWTELSKCFTDFCVLFVLTLWRKWWLITDLQVCDSMFFFLHRFIELLINIDH